MFLAPRTFVTEMTMTNPEQRTRRWPRGPSRLWAEAIDRAFPPDADLMSRAIKNEEKRYRRFGRAHMVWFRVTSVVEIVLSVSFPFVIAVLSISLEEGEPSPPGHDAVITGISVAIALVGAISGFFAWNDNWRLYRTQQLAVTIVIRKWELEILELLLTPEPSHETALEITKSAIGNLTTTLQHEQDMYFGSVQLPGSLLAGTPPNSVPGQLICLEFAADSGD